MNDLAVPRQRGGLDELVIPIDRERLARLVDQMMSAMATLASPQIDPGYVRTRRLRDAQSFKSERVPERRSESSGDQRWTIAAISRIIR